MDKNNIFPHTVRHDPRDDHNISVYYGMRENGVAPTDESIKINRYTVTFFKVSDGEDTSEMLADDSVQNPHEADYCLPFTVRVRGSGVAAMDLFLAKEQDRKMPVFGLSVAHCVVILSSEERCKLKDVGTNKNLKNQYDDYEKLFEKHLGQRKYTATASWSIEDHKKGTLINKSNSVIFIDYRLAYTPSTTDEDGCYLLRDIALFQLDDDVMEKLQNDIGADSNRFNTYVSSAMYKKQEMIQSKVRGIISIPADFDWYKLSDFFCKLNEKENVHPIKIVIGQTLGHISSFYTSFLNEYSYQDGCCIVIQTDRP